MVRYISRVFYVYPKKKTKHPKVRKTVWPRTKCSDNKSIGIIYLVYINNNAVKMYAVQVMGAMFNIAKR